ncbi:type III secretion protein [Herbaspirillum rubrisubalbicans]|uniref:flagellar biosynthetic protein FliR n=1 Tax=Herbaspirillum rubrisubalbicans TaxID=80842 RepID=UPI000DC2A27E|nr:flagellar biosynthetic protein FliR [Herbaspirillum rubrisubalbicans]RAN48439.1 type III secretion protein [Herbaspirillum rubrisubalbicans]
MSAMSDLMGFSAMWLAKILLLSLRVGVVFTSTPLLPAASVPLRVRLLLILALSAALSLALPPIASLRLSFESSALFLSVLREIALGCLLAVSVSMAFAVFSIAGRLLDIQIGFGMGQVLDPTSNLQLPILTTVFNHLALIIFFLLNGPNALLRGLAYSLEHFPLGQPWSLMAASGALFPQLAGLFALSFSLVAPVVFCVLMVEMALGVLSRNLPQMNMLALGIPVKILVGVLALVLWFAGIGNVMSRIYWSIYRTWDNVFAVQARVN